VNKPSKPISETHPDLAKEAHGWDPKTISAGSDQKLEWICIKKHVWKSAVSSRSIGSGCPICSNQKVLKGFNDLSTTHPDLAKEAFGWDPTTVIAGSGKKFIWKCQKEHLYPARGSKRVRGQGCPYCTNKKVLLGFNDLATTHPDVAKEADGWDPTTVTIGSGKERSWKCVFMHTWTSSINGRGRGRGCPVCANQKVLKGFNDLATINPELAVEAFGWDPTTVISGSNKKLEWKCSFGHTWEAAPSTRKKGFGCAVCANQKVLKGFNDLATTHPDLAKEAFGWDPSMVISGTNKILEWKCSFGHTWKMAGNTRASGGQNCPICSNHQVLPGFNDLSTTHPDLAKEAFGWDPTTVIAGTNKRLAWKCPEGHEWSTTGGHRIRGRGCPSCAKSGFDPNSPAYLYFLHQSDWNIYQIGITNVPETRLKKHKRNGFEVYEIRGPMDGYLTQEIEQSILRFLKSKNVNLPASNLQGKFDGYTESWTMKSFKVNNLKELIDMASDAGF
jgi:hypothetical protein